MALHIFYKKICYKKMSQKKQSKKQKQKPEENVKIISSLRCLSFNF